MKQVNKEINQKRWKEKSGNTQMEQLKQKRKKKARWGKKPKRAEWKNIRKQSKVTRKYEKELLGKKRAAKERRGMSMQELFLLTSFSCRKPKELSFTFRVLEEIPSLCGRKVSQVAKKTAQKVVPGKHPSAAGALHTNIWSRQK